MKEKLYQILSLVKFKHDYEIDASIEFRKHYGDVFVTNDVSRKNENSFTDLKPEYQHLSGKWDAFDHTYTSAIITANAGRGFAHFLGDINELRPNNSPASENQDKWNNALARDIGDLYQDLSQISNQVFQAVESNQTINDRNDPRQYNGQSWLQAYCDISLPSFDLDASQIWTKAQWASGQINNFSYSNYNNSSSSLSIPNFTLSNPIQDAIKHLGNAKNHASPLAIDLDNDGIETTHLNDKNIFFDIKNTGFANRVGWIKEDDGILALDRSTKITKTNNDGSTISNPDGTPTTEIIAPNGMIDNITELFGDYRMSAWDELALLDSNDNKKIDSGDEQFNNLKIWRDLNQNGISEEVELKSLSEYNIKEINLNYTTLDQYQNENYISGNSSITYDDNSTKQSIYDVHFLNDNANTWYKGSQSEQYGNNFEIKVEALLLPLSRGYGDLPSLHIALSKDNTLLQMVTDFSTLDKDRFSEIPTLLENILYRWAGVDSINPDSVAEADGSNIDARKLRFIEKFAGVEWEQLGNRYIVGHFASLDIKKAWDGIFSEMLNRFLVQGPLNEIFLEAKYDFTTDKITLNDSYQNIIQKIEEFGVTDINFASEIAHILYLNKDELGINFTQINSDLSNIFGQNFGFTDEVIKINWGTDLYYSDMEKGNVQINEDKEILKLVTTDNAETINASNIGNYIFAKAGNDSINGGSNEDYIDGGSGDDVIFGNGDNDWLVGGDGDDNMSGGDGRDKMTGGAGSDILMGDSGDDTIEGGEGADVIDGGDGLDAITYYDSKVGITVNLKTNSASGGDANGDSFVNIENVHGSIYSDIINGNDGNNFLHGENGNDKIYGEDGDDILFNGFGKSELYGGAGNDALMAYDGAGDLLDGGNGIDLVYYNRPDIKSRLIIDLMEGKTIYPDMPVIIDGYRIDYYYLVLLDEDFNVYLRSGGTKGITQVKKEDFLDFDSDFRKTYGSNFLMIQIDPIAIKVPIKVQAYDTLKNIENIEAGVYADFIIGDNANNKIYGNGGADNIRGGEGNDIIFGDVDFLFHDTQFFNYNIAFESDQISGGDGDDVIYGGNGNDIINGEVGNDNLSGGFDDDQINGGQGNDVIDGGAGVDIAVYSGNQNDYDIVQFENGFNVIHKDNGSDGLDQMIGIEKLQFSDITIVLNRAPTVTLQTANTNEDAPIMIDVLDSASDIDGNTLMINSVTGGSYGVVSIVTNADGKQQISYTPNDNYSGNDNFNYTISDGRGGVVTKTLNIDVQSVNDAPIAVNDSFATSEDRSIKILFSEILGNDSDVEDGLELQNLDADNIIFNNPEHGTIIKNSDSITYTPNANYHGNDSISYQIKDSGGASSINATINLSITSINDTPTIASIIPNSAIDEDSTNIVLSVATILSAFSDIEGDVLSYQASLANGDPLPSWLSINEITGEITSTNPSNNDVGNYELVITASDSSGASVSQNFMVTVNNVNDAPTSSLITGEANEDSAQIILAFAGSDIDVGDSLSYAILSNPALGSVVNNNDGTFTFNLGNDFQNLALGQTKDVSFTYVATDNSSAQSNISTATITITGTNDSPTATITSIATNEDNSVKIDVLAGASDVDASDILSLTSVTNGLHATASITTDASGNKFISYVPNANYNGADVITYTISDNNGGLVTKELTVTVNAVNDAPIIASATQNQSAQSGKAFTYTLPSNLFSDIDGDKLTISATLADGSPLPSWLSFDGAKFSGTPTVALTTNFAIKLKATDPSGASISQNFAINVTNPNNAPIAKNDVFATNEDTSLTISFASILSNDSDVEDKTNIQKLTKDNIIFNNPLNGKITITNTGIIYTPNKDFNGSDVITYQIKDSSGALSNKASIDLTIKPVNDLAVAGNDSFVTNEDKSITIKLSDLLANDSDIEDGLAIQNLTMDKFVFTNPSKGTIVKDAVKGTITYTSNKNYYGTDSLTYQIKDSSGVLSNKATIGLTVNKVNDAPVATNDALTLNEDTALTISFASILKNDSDIEDGVNIQKLTKDNIIFNNPLNGKITITNTGIIYTPNKDFNGSDVITYQIKDSSGALSNKASIDLTIKPVNDLAVAGNDSFVTNEDKSITIKLSDLLANDSDIEDGLAIQNLTMDKFVFTNPSKGTIVKDSANRTIKYTPNNNYNGSDVIYYQIKDSSGELSNKASINLLTNSVNDAPVISTKLVDQSFKAGNTFNYTLPANSFTDVDKDHLTYSAKLADGSNLPSWLKFDSANKTFSGTAPSGVASVLSIKLTASDGSLETSQNFSLKITSNVINGTSKNNSLNGTTTNDEIYGNDGNDTIKGNAGNDLIIGGKGADILLGGIGKDQFIFKNLTDSTINGSDLISDFTKGQDKINLFDLGFDHINSAGNGDSDQGLEYSFDGTNTLIQDRNSNFMVKLTGQINLENNDFIF